MSKIKECKNPKTPSPKPARIPPQTPPAGGKSAEAGRIHIPSQMFRPAESALAFRVLRKMGSDFFKQTPSVKTLAPARALMFLPMEMEQSNCLPCVGN